MEPIIRKAIPDDAKAVAAVINSVILEGKYTALTNPIQVIADNTRALRFF